MNLNIFRFRNLLNFITSSQAQYIILDRGSDESEVGMITWREMSDRVNRNVGKNLLVISEKIFAHYIILI